MFTVTLEFVDDLQRLAIVCLTAANWNGGIVTTWYRIVTNPHRYHRLRCRFHAKGCVRRNLSGLELFSHGAWYVKILVVGLDVNNIQRLVGGIRYLEGNGTVSTIDNFDQILQTRGQVNIRRHHGNFIWTMLNGWVSIDWCNCRPHGGSSRWNIVGRSSRRASGSFRRNIIGRSSRRPSGTVRGNIIRSSSGSSSGRSMGCTGW